jgi:hypothetical protein
MDNTAAKLDRIITKARREPKAKFTYLKYLLNEEYLFSCYQELKHNKAAGVDGRTVESYAKEEITALIAKQTPANTQGLDTKGKWKEKSSWNTNCY